MNKQSITSLVFLVTLSSMHVTVAASADQNGQPNTPVQTNALSGKVIAGGTVSAIFAYGIGELVFAYKNACKDNEKLTFVNFLKDKELLKVYLGNQKVSKRAVLVTTSLCALGIGAHYLNKKNAPATPNSPKKEPSNPAKVEGFRGFASKVGKFEQRQREKETKAREAELARLETERLQREEEAERQREAGAQQTPGQPGPTGTPGNPARVTSPTGDQGLGTTNHIHASPVQPVEELSAVHVEPILQPVLQPDPVLSSAPQPGALPPATRELSAEEQEAAAEAAFQARLYVPGSSGAQSSRDQSNDGFTPDEIARLTAALTPAKIAWIKTQKTSAENLARRYHGDSMGSSTYAGAVQQSKDLAATLERENGLQAIMCDQVLVDVLVNVGATIAWQAGTKNMNPVTGKRVGKKALIRFITEDISPTDLSNQELALVQEGCCIQ